jgi:hypothetical protein
LSANECTVVTGWKKRKQQNMVRLMAVGEAGASDRRAAEIRMRNKAMREAAAIDTMPRCVRHSLLALV